ncbi:hypothetical protein [Asaia prunellae]|nr:hypothetical protein [Asaia prunellae]
MYWLISYRLEAAQNPANLIVHGATGNKRILLRRIVDYLGVLLF